ncbi:Isoamyl acetate-hydrolyzing esterase [Phytophthora megakarya]|uniref:Isoamyl acetate-hydrolyzing esterase n=1 Tax=Phytophthora megakarya TaxID=4795 RepID=A0A225VJX8_9STRA|nr:Isoamyl acetate-hydrolyzing esterase [Phytophthora megakarya]
MTRILLVCCTLIIVLTSSVTCQTAPPSNLNLRPVLLLAGDSLTARGTSPKMQGWVELLQDRYLRSSDVIARGFSGYNTKWFLKEVMPVLENEISKNAYTPPSLITVWLGTNDAVLTNGSNSERHVPIDEYKDNLVKIVDRFRTAVPDAKLLLITPSHIDDIARAKFADDRTDAKRGLVDRTNAVNFMGNYSRACVEVANSFGVPVLDMYTYFNAMPETTRNAMLEDGVHFNVAGNAAVGQELHNKLKAEFPTLISALDTWQLPPVSKFEAEDPWKADNSPTNSS